MTPEQALRRRESRIDALIDQVEAGQEITDSDWRRLDQLNVLELMSVEQNATAQILDFENQADGISHGPINPNASDE